MPDAVAMATYLNNWLKLVSDIGYFATCELGKYIFIYIQVSQDRQGGDFGGLYIIILLYGIVKYIVTYSYSLDSSSIMEFNVWTTTPKNVILII